MARKPVTIGGREFPSQKAATEHFRAIRKAQTMGVPIASPAIHNDLVALLTRHPQAEQRIGPGVDCFFVDRAPDGYGTSCFWVRRLDGTETDFSVTDCIRGADPPPLARFKRALRSLVHPQIAEFKEKAMPRGTGICAVTGDVLAWAEAHVDHEAPLTFDALVSAFMVEEWVGDPLDELQADTIASATPLLCEEGMARRWVAFHADRARLRLVRSAINLRMGKRSGDRRPRDGAGPIPVRS